MGRAALAFLEQNAGTKAKLEPGAPGRETG
jgi:hypothetical protein